MIMPGMLAVVHDFHAPESKVASSLTAYVLGGASLQLILGPLSDRYGRRPLMLIGSGLFVIFTLLLPWTQNIHQFLAGRFMQGMGLCYLNVVGYALLQEIFSDEDAIRLITIMANIAILAPLMGPLLGSVFLQYGNWHDLFYMSGGLAAIVFCGLWRFMPESVGQIKRDGQKIKRSTMTVSVILYNYRTLLRHKVFVFGTVAYGLLGVICIVWIALSPVMLVSQAKLSLIMYGVWQIPVFGAFVVGNMLLSYLAYRYSVTRLSLVGSGIVFVSLMLMWLLPMLKGAAPIWLMPGLICYCFGYGLAVTALNRFILFVTQVSTGTTAALINTISMGFQALGISVANMLYVKSDNLHIAQYAGGVGICYIILVVLSFRYHHREKALKLENL